MLIISLMIDLSPRLMKDYEFVLTEDSSCNCRALDHQIYLIINHTFLPSPYLIIPLRAFSATHCLLTKSFVYPHVDLLLPPPSHFYF